MFSVADLPLFDEADLFVVTILVPLPTVAAALDDATDVDDADAAAEADAEEADAAADAADAV